MTTEGSSRFLPMPRVTGSSVCISSANASELISEGVVAMEFGATSEDPARRTATRIRRRKSGNLAAFGLRKRPAAALSSQAPGSRYPRVPVRVTICASLASGDDSGCHNSSIATFRVAQRLFKGEHPDRRMIVAPCSPSVLPRNARSSRAPACRRPYVPGLPAGFPGARRCTAVDPHRRAGARASVTCQPARGAARRSARSGAA